MNSTINDIFSELFRNREPRPESVRAAGDAPSYRFAGVPFTYAISFGVHKRDMALLSQLNGSIERLRPQIAQMLAAYHVPTISEQEEQ